MQNKIFSSLAIIFLVILFKVYPNIDLYISSLFYNSSEIKFSYADSFLIKVFFILIQSTLVIFVLGVCVSGLKKLKEHKSINPKHYRPELFIGLTAALGPGLFVHEFLKSFVGRPRPIDIENFGGSVMFQRAFEISNQCVESCSFVSGHSSIGFIFMTLAFVVDKKNKNKFLLLGIILGLLFGLVRIIQGAHFASDVVFAGVIVYITAALLDLIIKPQAKITK